MTNFAAMLQCAMEGHFTVGPTGDSMRCLRCGKQLDGMGLDPEFSDEEAER